MSAAVSTLDFYDQGRDHLRAGRFREAALKFQRVLDERPQDFWPNFYQGICAYRLGQFHDALAAFRTCIALVPRFRGMLLQSRRVAEALGRPESALRDYTRALELDPGLTRRRSTAGILATGPAATKPRSPTSSGRSAEPPTRGPSARSTTTSPWPTGPRRPRRRTRQCSGGHRPRPQRRPRPRRPARPRTVIVEIVRLSRRS